MSPRRWAVRAAAVALMLGCAAAAEGQGNPPVRIRLGTLVPQGTSYHHLLQAEGEQWRNATGGQVQLTVYAGTMGSELELVRRMRLGQLQAATLTVVGLREIDRAVGALQLMPLMFRSLAELDFVRGRLEPVLTQRLADRGFVVLFWADAGWVRFFTRRPATRPDDFRHLKIFTTAGDPETTDLVRSGGFQPVPLEWSDALTALQTGMIDVVPTIPYHALAMQYYTVASNMLEVNWVPLVGAEIVSKRVWDALMPETQAALRAAAVETARQFEERGRIESDEAVAAMRRRGLNVIPVPPAVEAEWRSLSETFYPKIRGTLVPADMFDEVLRLLQEYRGSHPGSN